MKSQKEAGNYIWNSIGGLINAGQSVFLLIVITRVCGLEAAGVFSIAFATGNLFLYLGNYGVRNYQVSDLARKYAFEDYLRHRILTMVIMLLAGAAYTGRNLLTGNYSAAKAAVVFLMCLLKAVDCMEEVFEGRLQQQGRLDLAGKLMTFRLIVSIGGMMIVLALSADLLSGTIAATILAALAAGVMIIRYRNVIGLKEDVSGLSHSEAIRGLFRECFPVCMANFLSFYLINAPKYAIDAVMDETAQARYNFIAMPVFVIQLLNMFMYQPVLVRMTQAWESKDRKVFLRYFFVILAGLAVIAAACLGSAFVLGIPVLSALYATDLTDLKGELMLILVGGVFLALNGFYSAVLTIQRCQKRIPYAYLAGTVLALLITSKMSVSLGIMGAVMAFLATMILVSVILTVLFISALRKQ